MLLFSAILFLTLAEFLKTIIKEKINQ